MTQPKEYKIKLQPKQLQFIKSNKREVLFSGGMGSGKSVALCVKLLQHALIPNSFCLLTRKTRESITNSTLRTLIYGEKGFKPILLPGSYEFFESRSIIKMNGGGEIAIVGCDNPFKIRSINASSIFIDESVELDEEEYIALNSRLRNTADDNRCICSATNPGSERHFLYKRFFTDKDDTREVITATLQDNKYLPKDYVEAQLKLTGASLKRYVHAQWCSNEGMVYKEYNPDKHEKKMAKEDFSKFIIAADIGYTNDPTCILVGGLKDNKVHILEEFYENGTMPTKITAEIEERYKRYPNAEVVIDPSAAGIRLELENKGIAVIKANNSIDEGISRVKDLLINERISFSHGLANLSKEFELYSYKEGTDKPIDKWNHALDTLRYLVARMFDNTIKAIEPTLYVIEPDDDQDDDQDDEDVGFTNVG